MSPLTQPQNIFQATLEGMKRFLRYMAKPIFRIFGPVYDDYPETGVQPFEGEPANDQQY